MCECVRVCLCACAHARVYVLVNLLEKVVTEVLVREVSHQRCVRRITQTKRDKRVGFQELSEQGQNDKSQSRNEEAGQAATE